MKVKSVLNINISAKAEVRTDKKTYYIDILRKDGNGNYLKDGTISDYGSFENHNTIRTLPADVLDATVSHIYAGVGNVMVVSTI